jgi:hypothetical protein
VHEPEGLQRLDAGRIHVPGPCDRQRREPERERRDGVVHGRDADADTDPDTDPDADTDSHPDPHPDAHADFDSDSDSDANSDAHADSDADGHSDAGAAGRRVQPLAHEPEDGSGRHVRRHGE